MKKFMSMVLSAALTLSLATPAAAAAEVDAPAPAESSAPEKGSTDRRLAQVTEKVKATLGIGDQYEEFYGELMENELGTAWNLNWSGNGEKISVEAAESGKILRYHVFSEEAGSSPSANGGGVVPTFPAVSREQAQKSAEAFLKKVLDSQENAQFSDQDSSRLSMSSHRFTG